MKKLLCLGLFMLPILCFAQFNIDYNPVTNTLSVEYTGCEICLLNSPIDVEVCKCRDACNNMGFTVDEINEFDDCVEQCEIDFGDDPVNLEYCLDACDIKLDARRRICLEACGVSPSPVTNIFAYSYRLSAVWDVIPFDPRNQPDISHWRYFDFDYTETNMIEIEDWVIPAPWPAVYFPHNTCVGIGMNIYYGDGSFCEYTV